MMPANLKDVFQSALEESQEAALIAVEASLAMSEAARHRELRRVLERYADLSRDQANRIAFLRRELESETRACLPRAMDGVRACLHDALATQIESQTLDALLIGLAQKAAHLQIATYGTLCAWAKTLGDGEALQKLKPCLSEAKGIDARLTDVADEFVNASVRA